MIDTQQYIKLNIHGGLGQEKRYMHINVHTYTHIYRMMKSEKKKKKKKKKRWWSHIIRGHINIKNIHPDKKKNKNK